MQYLLKMKYVFVLNNPQKCWYDVKNKSMKKKTILRKVKMRKKNHCMVSAEGTWMIEYVKCGSFLLNNKYV